MKPILTFFGLSLLFVACSRDDSNIQVPPAKNTAPTPPSILRPKDAVCLDTTEATLIWEASTDADKDTLTYTVELSKSLIFIPIDETYETSDNSIKITNLTKATNYFWRVRANDKESSSANSLVGKFSIYTEPIPIETPLNPIALVPTLDSKIGVSAGTTINLDLKWTIPNPDKSIDYTYDVYFGTSDVPNVKVASDTNGTTATVSVTSGKDYYWKIVIKDSKGNETTGPIWHFDTTK